MGNWKRSLAAGVYGLAAQRIHPGLRFGFEVRNHLARRLCLQVDPTAQVGAEVMLSRGIRLLPHAGIGSGTWFLGGGEVILGERLKMGPQCMFITNDHPVPPPGRTFEDEGGSQADIVIGADVFIGARAIILPGVHIGDGAAIGAGAVVTRDVPPGGVAVGNPAKVVRVRESALS